jgi:hypothetical protein
MPDSPTLTKYWGRMALAVLLVVGGLQGLWVLKPAFWDHQNLIAAGL